MKTVAQQYRSNYPVSGYEMKEAELERHAADEREPQHSAEPEQSQSQTQTQSKSKSLKHHQHSRQGSDRLPGYCTVRHTATGTVRWDGGYPDSCTSVPGYTILGSS